MIPKQQIQMAKRADLPCILKGLGIELVSCGKDYHLSAHDSLKLFMQDGIWLYKWWSRNGEVGDGIQYLQRHCGMSFPEAVSILSGTAIVQNTASQHLNRQNRHRPGPIKKPETWRTKKWQRDAEKLIRVGRSYLLGPNGKERISYLVHQRGLDPGTIRQRRLGWLPEKRHMPSKLLIPCYDSQGHLIRIRFRIDTFNAGQQRYRISKGSNPHSPYPIAVAAAKPLMILESELDAILIAQEAAEHIGVLAMGTTAMKFKPAMIRYLSENIPIILISLDNDQSGKEKTSQLIRELPNAIEWPVPEKYGKDPGEAFKRINLKHWIEIGLKSHSTQGIKHSSNPGIRR
jgi:DNA primase